MSYQVFTRSAPVNHRSTPLLFHDDQSPKQLISPTAKSEKRGRRFAEVVGSGTAECSAVCCCFPCLVMEMLYLGFYKLPKGICKKVLRHRNRKIVLKKKHTLLGSRNVNPSWKSDGEEMDLIAEVDEFGVVAPEDAAVEAEDLEKEMLDQFYGAGFWRSASQKES